MTYRISGVPLGKIVLPENARFPIKSNPGKFVAIPLKSKISDGSGSRISFDPLLMSANEPNTNRSAPMPPSKVSIPAPPINVSSPTPPINVSFSSPPSKLSFPLAPSRLSAPPEPMR